MTRHSVTNLVNYSVYEYVLFSCVHLQHRQDCTLVLETPPYSPGGHVQQRASQTDYDGTRHARIW